MTARRWSLRLLLLVTLVWWVADWVAAGLFTLGLTILRPVGRTFFWYPFFLIDLTVRAVAHWIILSVLANETGSQRIQQLPIVLLTAIVYNLGMFPNWSQLVWRSEWLDLGLLSTVFARGMIASCLAWLMTSSIPETKKCSRTRVQIVAICLTVLGCVFAISLRIAYAVTHFSK